MIYLKYIRKNNVLEFSDGKRLSFLVSNDRYGYYATTFNEPFEELGIHKLTLQKKILGYSDLNGGRFPYCKTKEDVIKLLRGLQKESKIKYYQENEL